MSKFSDDVAKAKAMVDSGEVTQDVLGELDATEIIFEMESLVSEELTHLAGLSDDADANEEAMRQVMQNAAIKAFFAGLLVVQTKNDAHGVPVGVSPEVLQEIGLRVIRDGVITFTLFAEDEE